MYSLIKQSARYGKDAVRELLHMEKKIAVQMKDRTFSEKIPRRSTTLCGIQGHTMTHAEYTGWEKT